jgi:hypothetical protein
MRRQFTGVWLYVPERFLALDLPGMDKYRDELNWFVHKIICGNVRTRHSDSEYVNISRQTMEKYIHPTRVSTIRDTLLQAGVIECDNLFIRSDFSQNGKSYGYRLAAALHGPNKRTEVTKPRLAARIIANRLTYHHKAIGEDTLPAHARHLLQCLRRTRINKRYAYRAVKAAMNTRRTNGKNIGNILHLVKMTVDTIVNREHEFHICRYGRVHTNITRLLTEARSCLTINGEPLSELDIANSQIIFLVMLMRETPAKYTTATTKKPNVTRSPDAASANKPNLPPGKTVTQAAPHTPTTTFSLPPDVERFIELTCAGQMYNHLMRLSGYTDRGRFKKEFFRDVLYGEDGKPYCTMSPLRAVFKKEFPSVDAFIRTQKREKYQELARKMQKRESSFVIDTVCARLCRECPEIPLVTVHDSIMTTPKWVAMVRDVFLDEFRKLGVEATIREGKAPRVAIGRCKRAGRTRR